MMAAKLLTQIFLYDEDNIKYFRIGREILKSDIII